jgi:DNA repair photolyase
VPAGVSVAPVIPGLNDHEIPTILEAARDAGALFATYTIVRLPGSVSDVFQQWLARNVSPESAEKILGRIRDLRGGKLNDLRPGIRMRGEGELAEQISRLFKVTARKLGLTKVRPEVTSANFRRVESGQMELF